MLGTALLLAAIVGSGIMAQRLYGGSIALALLCNTIATGAILGVLILMLAPISGAHFNPAVTLAFALRGEVPWTDAAAYLAAQIAGAIAGVVLAHLMFELPLLQLSVTERSGAGQCCRGRRHLRPAVDDPWRRLSDARGRSLRGQPLYHLSLLVHVVDVVRQSRRYHRPLTI